MNKSYAVSLSGDVKYKNSRNPHIETSVQGIEGNEYKLGTRTVKNMRNGVAVMYNIDGLSGAHITTKR